MTQLLENERVRLLEMVELAPFTVLVLRGPRLLVEAFTPRFAPALELAAVQNRSIDEMYDQFWQDGAPLVRLIHEVYSQNVTRTTSKVLIREPQDGEPAERYVVYTLVPSHDANKRVGGVLVYALDETERLLKEAEEERKRLRLIFEHSHAAALALYDANTSEFIMGSPRYVDTIARLKGKEVSQLPGSLFQELTPLASDKEAEEIWKSVVENHAPLHLPEFRLKLDEDEPESVWDWTLTPIARNEEAGTAEYLLVTAIEVTEQAQVRQKAEELLRLKDEFLSLASHELRTPLTTIQGNAPLLQLKLKQQAEKTDSSEQDIQMAERVMRQARRLNALIGELLDASRIQDDVLELKNEENVDLVEVTRRVIDGYATTGREIKLENATKKLVGKWDEVRLEQVLHNLLKNAIKYSPENTSVSVRIERKKNEAVVSIKDQGSGLSKEEQEHIFDRYFRVSKDEQSKAEGLGLGLYIAQNIITHSGGRMWVESKSAEGSTFSFALPVIKVDDKSRGY